jgi:hypothetical protein
MILTIIQCEKCRRYVAGDSVFNFLAPSSAEYEAFKAAEYPQGDCGRRDCEEQVQRNKSAEAARTAKRVEWRRTHGSRGPRRGSQASARPVRSFSGAVRSSCPPDTEPMQPSGLSHQEEQRRFMAAGDGDNDCEQMIEILFAGGDPRRAQDADFFRPEDPARQSIGKWVSRQDLVHKYGIETPNSRASQLRGCDSYDPHPLVKRFRLDIDSAKVDGEWSYRVCFIEHSERLKREQKQEPDQEKFA